MRVVQHVFLFITLVVFMPDLRVFCSMYFGQDKIIIFIYNITCKLTCKVINFKDEIYFERNQVLFKDPSDHKGHFKMAA